MQLQKIAQVIETNAMAQLSIQQADGVAPGTERARLILHAGLPRCFGDLVFRNEIANLAQNVNPASRRLELFVFHACLGQFQIIKPTLLSNFLWDGCDGKSSIALISRIRAKWTNLY
jgi:hypothetical protein